MTAFEVIVIAGFVVLSFLLGRILQELRDQTMYLSGIFNKGN